MTKRAVTATNKTAVGGNKGFPVSLKQRRAGRGNDKMLFTQQELVRFQRQYHPVVVSRALSE